MPVTIKELCSRQHGQIIAREIAAAILKVCLVFGYSTNFKFQVNKAGERGVENMEVNSVSSPQHGDTSTHPQVRLSIISSLFSISEHTANIQTSQVRLRHETLRVLNLFSIKPSS